MQVQEVMEESKQRNKKKVPKDISHLLRTTGLMETRYIRQLASMCSQTYYLNKLSVRILTSDIPMHGIMQNAPEFIRLESIGFGSE